MEEEMNPVCPHDTRGKELNLLPEAFYKSTNLIYEDITLMTQLFPPKGIPIDVPTLNICFSMNFGGI
jgi:hypothetical protein